jgi:uncharacterized membrane protein AbrB (regulator of aidB expression)
VFDFTGYFDAIKKHWLLFALTLLVVVIFFSAPFIWLWRSAKRIPGVGAVLDKVPGAAA